MHAAAAGIIGGMRDLTTYGTEWDDVYPGMWVYGTGGIVLWGTLCGVPNGCVAMLNLMGLHNDLANEVLGYYSTTSFPTDIVNQMYATYGPSGTNTWTPANVPIPDDEVMAKTVSNSPICHISVSRWLAAAGVSMPDRDHPDWCCGPHTTTLKQDRCSKMAAACVRRTAEIINDYCDTGFTGTDFFTGQPYESCMDCHSYRGGATSPFSRKDIVGQMDCAGCHNETGVDLHGPKTLIIEDVWTEGETAPDVWEPMSDFSAGDKIRCYVQFATLGPGPAYVISGSKSKIKLMDTTWKTKFTQKGETIMPQVTKWFWEKTVPNPVNTGPGQVIVYLNLRDYDGGIKLAHKKKIVGFNIV